MKSQQAERHQPGGRTDRRSLLKLGGAAGLSAAMPGVVMGGMAGRPAHAQGPVEIVFAFGPEESGTLQAMIDAFNEEKAGQIKVRWREMAREADDFFGQVRSDFEVGGADVDVIGGDVAWTAELAAQGWIRDISGRFHDAFSPNAFVPAAMNSAVYGFEIYGVPWYTDAGMLFYRRDLLEAAGYDAPPATWDELKAMAQKVMEEAGTAHGLVFQGAAYEGGVTNALEYIWNAGGRVLTSRVTFAAAGAMTSLSPSHIVVDSSEAALGFEIARSMVADGIAPEAVATFREKEAWEVFLAGDAVFMRNWPYVYGLLRDPEQSAIMPDQVGVAPIPVAAAGDRSFSCHGGWNLMISAFSNQDDAAWEFIRFAASPEWQKRRAIEGGYLPVFKDLYEDEEILAQVPVIALGQEALANARTRPVTPQYSRMSPRIALAFNRTLRGEIEPREAVRMLERELESILRRFG